MRPRLLTTGEPQRHVRAAAFAVADAQPPAVRLDDLAAQREAQARSRGFRRIERHERILERRGREARPAIAYFDRERVMRFADRELDVLRPRARFARILEQVDQRLLDLG